MHTICTLHNSLILLYTWTGLKVDLAKVTDSIEASSLGYKNNYIQVYSNSWGPNNKGFFVEKPGILLENVLKNAVKRVIYLALTHQIMCIECLTLFIGSWWEGLHFRVGFWEWWMELWFLCCWWLFFQHLHYCSGVSRSNCWSSKLRWTVCWKDGRHLFIQLKNILRWWFLWPFRPNCE